MPLNKKKLLDLGLANIFGDGQDKKMFFDFKKKYWGGKQFW